jgi:transposase
MIPAGTRVVLATKPVDFRKGPESLMALVLAARAESAALATEAIALRATKADADLVIDRLQALLKALDRARYGPHSKKVDVDQHVLETIRAAERIFAAERTLPTLAPGTGKAKIAWLWTYARGDRPFGGTGPPMVASRFEGSEAKECVSRHLAGFRRLLQTDRYPTNKKVTDQRFVIDVSR